MSLEITDKLFYSIGEVSEITKVKSHVLRYWETEFKILNLEKNKQGERIYRTKDIELIKRIKHLLYDDGYTIAGAKKKLQKDKYEEIKPDNDTKQKYSLFLKEVKKELENILKKI